VVLSKYVLSLNLLQFLVKLLIIQNIVSKTSGSLFISVKMRLIKGGVSCMYKIKISPYAKIFYNEWLLDPDDSHYNLAIDQILYGDLDVSRLTAALKRYIADHVILNSHIHDVDGEPHWVKNTSISELDYVSSSISTADLFSYVTISFDLHREPLYRFKLMRIDSKTHRLLLVFHHIALDAKSVNEGLFKTLSSYYNDKNYVAKYSLDNQVKLLTNLSNTLSAKLEQHKAKYKKFWQDNLAEVENIDLRFLKLCKTNPKKALTEPGNTIGEIRFSYGRAELDKLNQIRRKYLVTPYSYGNCILALLINRYANQARFAISYPLAIKEGMDFIYGAQLNTNIIPYQFDQNTTVLDLLKQNRRFFRSLRHENTNGGYYPIADILNNRDKHLLDVGFIQTTFRDTTFEFQGITKVEVLNDLYIDGVFADTLLFEQELKDNQLDYRVRYDKRVINQELIDNFVHTYKRLFLEVLEDLFNGYGGRLIASYSLLTPKQYKTIVYEFNKTDKDYPKDQTIHQLFEEQVLKTPDNIAVVYEDTILTYKELNNKSNQLARYLVQNYNIKPDDLVALCLDRSEQMLIAILGVLKAGGAYVPLDSSYPSDRIGYMLNDTKTKVVLTNYVHANSLKRIIKPKVGKIDIISIDSKEMPIELANQKATNPVASTSNSNLAYVIYTSGTTGKPKGVMIEHGGVTSLVKNIDYIKIRPNDAFMQFSDPGFDAATFEIWASLLNGAKLFIPSNKMDLFGNIKLFSEVLSKNKITVLWLTKTLFDQLFLANKNVFENIRYLLVGGEALNKPLISRLINSSRAPKNVINGYGPTENTTFSCTLNITKANLASADTVPIGTALTNRKVYVLDKNLNPIPTGVIGELYVGGAGLSRGYLNNPNLTAEKFIVNPFQTQEEKSQNKNTRLYKTGDLVRWLLDRNLEYMGRNDFQVKIRGYRIELEEIENKLSSYPDIKQAAVIAKGRSLEPTSDKYLLAYYVADRKLDERKVLAYLAAKLPEYMIPKILIHINKLPLMANGKLDKQLLPEPELINRSEYEPPKNALEKHLCEMYAQVLNLPAAQIGIKSDFFKLGGDSISSLQLVSRVRQKLELSINVKDIFTYRNVEQLVNNVLANQNLQKEPAISIKREDNPIGKSDFLPIQEWFFDNIKNGFYQNHHHWNQSFMIKTPELDVKTLSLSIEKLLQHHDAFRLRYKNFEKNYIEIDFTKEAENIKKINTSNLTEEEVKKQLIAIQSNFNIEIGPIYTIAYLHGHKDKTARLFFAMHHLIIDSVSWRIITEDIVKLYELLKDKNNINKTSQELLGQKSTSYRQWVEAVKNYQPSQAELSHWDDALKDYSHIAKNNNKEYYGEFSLSSKLTQNLLTKANEEYHTQVSDVLLSALSRTLAQVFSRQINHITLEGHGREEISSEIDVTKTMGWFTTMYPVKLVNKPVISELINTTKENLKKIPNKGIGYGPIKGYKNLPNISFNYLGQIGGTGELWTIVDHVISIDPQNKSSNILDVYGYIKNGRLKFHVFCSNSDAKICADRFKANLEELIRYCSKKPLKTGAWLQKELEIKQNILYSIWRKIHKLNQDDRNDLIDLFKKTPQDQSAEGLFTRAINKTIELDEFFAKLKTIPIARICRIRDTKKLTIPRKTQVTNPEITAKDRKNILKYIQDKAMSVSLCAGNLKQNKLTTIVSEGNKKSDVFCMASVGKILTGILVFKMINDGVFTENDLSKAVQLDEEIIKALPPKVQDRLKAGEITLLHLMTHKSGLGDYVVKYQEDIENRAKQELEQIKTMYELLPFIEEEVYCINKKHYSNAGMLLLGFAIERAYKNKYKSKPLDFNSILQKYIIDKIGMPSFSTKMPIGPNVKSNLEDTIIAPNLLGGPAGAGDWINIKDLTKFAQWMYAEYYKTNSYVISFKIFLEKYGEEFYHKNSNTIEHNGSIVFAGADFFMSLSTGAFVAALSNQPIAAEEIKCMIVENVF